MNILFNVNNENLLTSNKKGPLIEFSYNTYEKRVTFDLTEVVSIDLTIPVEIQDKKGGLPTVNITFTSSSFVAFEFVDLNCAKKVYLYLKTEWNKTIPAEGGPELLQEAVKGFPEA